MSTSAFPRTVLVTEVGPRDGLQNEAASLSVEQKVELIESAVRAGAKTIEIGSFVHPKAIPQLADTDAVVQNLRRVDGVEYRGLVMNLKGVERAHAVGITKAKLIVSASRSHSLKNMKRTPEEVLDTLRPCYSFAKTHGITLSGAIPTSFGCPFEGEIAEEKISAIIHRFIEMGIEEISLSDTTGMANPKLVYERCSRLKDRFPPILWNLHFHNTRGMGLANVLAGMAAGFTRFDASFAGLGGCPYAPGASGNIATEDLVHMLHEMQIQTGYDLDKAVALAQRVESMVGHPGTGAIVKAGKAGKLFPFKP